MVEGQALASSQAGAGGVLVRGVREKDITRIPAIGNTIQPGGICKGSMVRRRRDWQTPRGATLPAARRHLDDHSPKGAETPFGITPRIKSYPVVADFEVGMSEFDAGFVYLPFTEAQGFFNRNGDATAIEIFLEGRRGHRSCATGHRRDYRTPDHAVGLAAAEQTFFGVLEVERNVMFLILMLIVLVAALNIVSGLIMLVKDKSADIAILRTMGATRGSIMRVFLITGAAIGVVGTLAGFALAW